MSYAPRGGIIRDQKRHQTRASTSTAQVAQALPTSLRQKASDPKLGTWLLSRLGGAGGEQGAGDSDLRTLEGALKKGSRL